MFPALCGIKTSMVSCNNGKIKMLSLTLRVNIHYANEP